MNQSKQDLVAVFVLLTVVALLGFAAFQTPSRVETAENIRMILSNKRAPASSTPKTSLVANH